jgi:hypothetical protein
MLKKAALFSALLFLVPALYSQTGILRGLVEWDRMELSAVISLNLREEGIKLPAGRSRAEALLEDRYPAMIRQAILDLRADSTSTVADLVNRGELSLEETERIPARALRVPPALSPDFASMSGRYTLSLHNVCSVFPRGIRAAKTAAPLIPVPARAYTGIIIIADVSLPIHGRNAEALLTPCLFPKVWDDRMELVYDRNMTNPDLAGIVCYASRESVTASTPSGLDERLAARVGNNPLKIMARGLYGQIPTDPVIDREDAFVIFSSEANRLLLRDGKIALILDKNALKAEL